MFVVINLLIPIIVLGFGFLVKYRPPRTINGFMGYRTVKSMKNQDTWDFAQKQMAHLWIWMGLAETLVSAIIVFFASFQGTEFRNTIEIVMISVQTVLLIISIIPIELALGKNFDKNGNRIEGEGKQS